METRILINQLKAMKKAYARSAWDKGLYDYAVEIVDSLGDEIENADTTTLLNGAMNWRQYSEGGCSLIADDDIAKRMCTPSEYKRYKNSSEKSRYNDGYYWLYDVQVRALNQAAGKVKQAYNNVAYFMDKA